MFGQGLATLFDLERGFFHTVLALFTRPGETCREYVEGRRRPLTGPFKYAFILITIYAIAVNLLEVRPNLPGVESSDEVEIRVYYLLNSLLGFLIFFIQIPVAAIQRLLFRSHGDSLGETYAFALYVFGHTAWFSTLFAVAGWLGQVWGPPVLLLVTVAYLAWAMTGFYRIDGFPPVFRAALMMVVNFVVTNVIALGLGNLIVWLGLLEPLADALA